MAKKPPINYTAKDFQTIKDELVNFAKVNYEGTYKDFNEASFGSMMFDLVAYIGDQLSFFVDYQHNENNIETAIELKNVLSQAKQRGYKYTKSQTSGCKCAFYVIIPAASVGNGPNLELIPILKKGTSLISTGGVSFILNEDVDFSNSSTEVVVSEFDDNGAATSFAFKTYGNVISGEIGFQSIEVGAYTKFLKLTLDDQYIQEIISVEDSEGNEYYEVDYLSQDIIYEPIKNKDSPSDANYILKAKRVARRFISEQDEDGFSSIQFGYGSEPLTLDEEFPDPINAAIELGGKNYFSEHSFDPTKLLKTEKFGVVPVNTTLVVTYRKNNSQNVNAGIGTINSISSQIVDFKASSTYSKSQKLSLISEFECDNEEIAAGDTLEVSIDEIRQRAKDKSFSQNRAVSKQDYLTLVYSMPSGFGSIKRLNILQDKDSPKRNLNLYVVSENQDGYLCQTPNIVKENVKTWLSNYKMINDTIDILDLKIINISIYFKVSAKNGKTETDVKSICINEVKKFCKNKMNAGEPLIISDIYKVLNSVNEVADTKDIKIIVKNTSEYASSNFNVEKNLSADGKVLYLPEDSIFEIKYLSKDIVGEVI